MNHHDTSLFESGQRVGLAVAKFPRELANFGPLQAAETDRAELVAAIGSALRLANTNYGPAYTLTVENRAATPLACPAGAMTVLTRTQLGPDTARYLAAQFAGQNGGQATVVRRVV